MCCVPCAVTHPPQQERAGTLRRTANAALTLHSPSRWLAAHEYLQSVHLMATLHEAAGEADEALGYWTEAMRVAQVSPLLPRP